MENENLINIGEAGYNNFFRLLSEIVNGNGSWQAKKAELLANCDSDENDANNLAELAGWFESEAEAAQ